MVREHPDPYLVLGVSPTATQAEITHAYRTRLRAHHPDTRHTPSSQTADEHLRQLLAVPRPAAFGSQSLTAVPTPVQPTSQRHHCGPARCAGTDSCDRAYNRRTTRITIPPHRGPYGHRHQQRTRETKHDSGDPKTPAGQGYADRDHHQATTRRSPHPAIGYRGP